MQLLILILSKTELMPQIVSRIVSCGCGDPTVIDCEGALRVIDKSEVEPPPIFGSLRYILHKGTRESKMMLTVMRDEDVPDAADVINEVTGGIDRPNTGIFFTIPISAAYGLRGWNQ